MSSPVVAATAVVHPWTDLDEACRVDEFVILGVPAAGSAGGEARLVVGTSAHIRSHTVLYAGTRIGARFQTGHGVLLREESRIGDDVSIGSHTVVEHHVTIGNRVRIHSNAFIPEYTVIEDDAWIGPNAVLTNAKYPRSPDAKRNLRGPRVASGAKVGANVTLLPGVVIGRDALVGAGSVVVDDVPEGAVAAGNPARVIGSVRDLGAYDGEGGA
jgi:acetyltransferase-like isoleucine patch superfamily enzyme